MVFVSSVDSDCSNHSQQRDNQENRGEDHHNRHLSIDLVDNSGGAILRGDPTKKSKGKAYVVMLEKVKKSESLQIVAHVNSFSSTSKILAREPSASNSLITCGPIMHSLKL